MSRELERMRKRSAERVAEAKKMATDLYTQADNNLGEIVEGQKRATEVYRNASVIIEDIDRDFERATKLNGTDVAFLFLATALQCVRQYVLTPMSTADTRPGDQEAAEKFKKKKEQSDRSHRLYNPSLEEVIKSPVPFDVLDGSNGVLAGYGPLGHRGATVGHDPIFGLIFGTANIATSTATLWGKTNPILMESYHVTTGKRNRDSFLLTASGKPTRASTVKVLDYTFNKKLLHQTGGKQIVAVSAGKEIMHLASDTVSKKSLPLPVISAIDPTLAGELAERGLNMASMLDVGKQFALALAIDTLIGIIHGFFYDPARDGSKQLYEVRTRRVLLYSNLIATTSNILASTIMAATGDVADATRFIDWGGFINTIRRLVIDTKFIEDVKRDFIKNRLYEMVVGDEYGFVSEAKALSAPGITTINNK